ncbi:MAG: class I SAM-dependent methyltransferase, partial [Bradymonadaceae bacterium]
MNDTATDHQSTIAHRDVIERLWTEPVFERCRDYFPQGDGGNVLVAESRCGYVPMKWIELLPEDTRIMALDSSSAMLDAARQRLGEKLQRHIFFVQQRVGDLAYADGVFQAAICCNGLVTARQVEEGLSELVRVTVTGGGVAVCIPVSTSFPEFYDLLDEAMRVNNMGEALHRIDELRNTLSSPARVFDITQRLHLFEIEVRELTWDVAFTSGRDFLHSPLIQESFFPHWLGS